MKKIFNYTFLALLVILGVSSCTNDYDYDPVAQEKTMQVYFPNVTQSVSLATDQNVIPVILERIVTDEQASVPVILNDPSGLFSIQGGNKAEFAAGADAATVNLTFDFSKIQPDTDYTVRLALSDSSYQTLYGAAITTVTLKYAPWSDWTPWADGTGTYMYSQYWSGADQKLKIYYRESLIAGSTQAQFRIDSWGSGISLYIDYDKETHSCKVAQQYVDEHPSYGPVYCSDIPSYSSNYTYDDAPSWYDPETGTFNLALAYYVSAGYFGMGYEKFSLDGFYIPDYSVNMAYLGAYKDTSDKCGAIVNFTMGEDVASYKYLILDGGYTDEECEAISQEIDADAKKVGAISSDENGMRLLEIENDGKYTIVTANYDEGENYVGYSNLTFAYEGPGGAKWETLGMCKYTDDIIASLFEMDPISYDVEVRVNADKPGIYRMVNPYCKPFPFNEEGDYDESQEWNIDINATDPDGVYFEDQYTGCDWGYGNMLILSYGYYEMLKGMSFAEAKANGILGTLKNNVITFPIDGILVGDDDGTYSANPNAAFALNLNPANAGVKSVKKSVAVKINKKVKSAKKSAQLKTLTFRQVVNVHSYKISSEKAMKGLQLRKMK